jgi:hypothetical protein
MNVCILYLSHVLSSTEQKNSTSPFIVKAAKGLTALTPEIECDQVSSIYRRKHMTSDTHPFGEKARSIQCTSICY